MKPRRRNFKGREKGEKLVEFPPGQKMESKLQQQSIRTQQNLLSQCPFKKQDWSLLWRSLLIDWLRSVGSGIRICDLLVCNCIGLQRNFQRTQWLRQRNANIFPLIKIFKWLLPLRCLSLLLFQWSMILFFLKPIWKKSAVVRQS